MTKWSMLAVALIIGWSSAVAAAPAVVVVDWTDMRSAPYSVAPLVGTLSRGEKVYVSSEVTDGWRRVISEGRLGYVRDTDVQVAGEPLSAVRAKLNPSNVAPPRIAQPWIVRPEIEWGGASDGFLSADENSIAGLAVTVGRNLTERFSTELTAGGGLFPGDIEANISPGFVTLAVARLAVALDDRTRRHALTLATGPMLIAGGPYGVVAFGHSEIGYEYRSDRFTVLLAAGPDVALNDSRRVQPVSPCGTSLLGGPGIACAIPFNRGDVFPHLRIGIGFAF